MSVTWELEKMGAPTFGSVARQRERLARLQHYDFKRTVDKNIAAAKLEAIKNKGKKDIKARAKVAVKDWEHYQAALILARMKTNTIKQWENSLPE
jgi:hypothetical protein